MTIDEQEEAEHHEEMFGGHEDPPEMVDTSTDSPYVPADPQRPF